ncbi:MAG: hypothetical protein WAN48_11120 [Actinomycetes bacterium]
MSTTRSPHTPMGHRSSSASLRHRHVAQYVAVVAMALLSTVVVVALTSTLVTRFG